MSKSQQRWKVSLGAASYLFASGLQVSGYTNPYVALALFLIGTAFLAVALWDRIRAADRKRDKSSTAHTPIIEPQQNWHMYQAMDYIAHRFGLTNEQDVDKKYTNVVKLVTRQAIAGQIHVWGKRINSDGPELVSREIPAEEWRNREILVWAASLPSAKEPQTRSTIVSPEGAYQFTDLRVNVAEIKAINWHSENARLYT